MLTTPTAITANDGKFGCSVAIGSIGGFMVVGEKGYPQQAYVYVESGDTWSLTATLVGSEKDLGKFVAVYDDTIVLSNPKFVDNGDQGHAFIYKYIDGKAYVNWNALLQFNARNSLSILYALSYFLLLLQGVGRIPKAWLLMKAKAIFQMVE